MEGLQLTPSELGSLNRERSLNGVLDLEISNRLAYFPRAIRPLLLSRVLEQACFSTLIMCLAYGSSAPHVGLSKGRIQLGMDERITEALLWGFSFLGASVADSYLGKLKTILLFSIFYMVGNIVMIIFSAVNIDSSLHIIPALLLMLGAGGVSPCAPSFGGDQFIPFQSRLTDQFFSLLYGAGILGAFTAHMVWSRFPDLTTRFSFALGCLSFSLVILLFGRYRTIPPPKRLLPWRVVRLICLATHRRLRTKHSEEPSHWLKHGKRPFSLEFIGETRLLLKVTVCALPTIFFWALHSHAIQGCLRPNPDLSLDPFGISLLVTLGLVPVLAFYVYPLLERKGTHLPVMRRMVWGYLLLLIDAFINNLTPSNLPALIVHILLLSLSQAVTIPSLDLFAYSQSGRQLKTLSAAILLLTNALGNIVASSITSTVDPPYQPWIIFGLAALGFISLVLLANCWYVSIEDEEIEVEIRKLIRKSNTIWFI